VRHLLVLTCFLDLHHLHLVLLLHLETKFILIRVIYFSPCTSTSTISTQTNIHNGWSRNPCGIEVISVIGGLLGIVGFGLDNFGSKEPNASSIKIAVGLDRQTLDGGSLSQAGGDLPDIRLFNNFGESLGMAVDPGRVGDGAQGEVLVRHNNDNKQQAAYTLFSANDNAI